MSEATELGQLLGQAIAQANEYKVDFIGTEEVTDINLTSIESVEVTGNYFALKGIIIGCAELPFVLDHPVHGYLDSAIYYLDGDYCSTEIHDTDFNLLGDENGNYVVSNNSEYIIV